MSRFLRAHLKTWLLLPLSDIVHRLTELMYRLRDGTRRELEAEKRLVDMRLGNPEANAAEIEALRAAVATRNGELAAARDHIAGLEEIRRLKDTNQTALAEQTKVAKAELEHLQKKLRRLRLFNAALMVYEGNAKYVSSALQELPSYFRFEGRELGWTERDEAKKIVGLVLREIQSVESDESFKALMERRRQYDDELLFSGYK
jgi:hypothetical protein